MFGYISRTASALPDGKIADLLGTGGPLLPPENCSRDPHAVLIASTPIVRPAQGGGAIVVANGSIHNRAELASALGIGSPELSQVSDSDLIRRAYERWGASACSRMFGDWCFAAWDASKRELFLARDHHGNTALYYHATSEAFAFSTSLRALLDLKLEPRKLDELYLGQVLIAWPGYHGERTIHTPIKRLPPAHHLTVTPDRLDVQRYWRLEDQPELKLPNRNDYADGLRAVFDRAVRERLPQAAKVATTLSGGLDSGAVTSTMAQALREQGRRLTAYNSTLIADPAPYVGARFADEWPLAMATAQAAGNVDLHPIDAATTTPIQAMRDMLAITLHPEHAAGNLFWLLDLYRVAARQGHSVLLTGQLGNPGISWTGSAFSQPLGYQIGQVGLRGWIKQRVRQALPSPLKMFIRRHRSSDWSRSAIASDFAKRLNLHERRLDDPWHTPDSPLTDRHSVLKPGRSIIGGFHAEMGAATGLRVTDPTADARVLEYCFSVPDHVFIDPVSGLDRWLVREAMKGRLPDAVRLNRQRGRQAGDLVPRLRACAAEVEEALDECERGPGAAYLDIARLRRSWNIVRVEDSPESFQLAGTVLTRGIMAGLFVNGFGKTW